MRRWGIALAVAGVLMLIAGAVLRFVVVPRAQVLPADTDETAAYTGDLTTLDVAALMNGDKNAVVRLPVTVDRTLKVMQTSGDKALVSDTATMKSSKGTVPPSLAKTQNYYTIDRSTLEPVPNFTGQEVTNAKGLVVGFPIPTEKKSYTGWLAEIGTTGTVKYVGEDTLKGLTVYKFEGTKSQVMPTPPAGAPTSLLKSRLGTLVAGLGLPAAVQQQLAQAVSALPEAVPLTYTYTQGDTYAVEPDTGIIVDMTRNTRITVGIGNLPVPQIPLMVLGIAYDDATVSDMAAKAADARDKADLYGTQLPIALGVIGLICLGAAVPMMRRRPKAEPVEAAPVTDEHHHPVG